MKKMILAALAACMCVCLCFGIFAACDDRSGNGEQPAEYTITANNGTGYTVDAPASAKEGDTVTVTVSVSDELRTVQSVTANGTACTAGTDGSYTFTMPAENVTIAVSLGYIQTEMTNDDMAFRASTPSQIAKARDEDTWAEQLIYFDFTENKNLSKNDVTVTSLNPNVIPQDAIDEIYLHSPSMGTMRDYGSFTIDLSKVSLGTAYIAVHAESSSATRIDATIIKKIDVVNYGEIDVETWDETVVLDLSDVFDRYNDITIQISDSDYQYGTTSQLVTVTAEQETMSVDIKYIPGHNYSVNVYYMDSTTERNVYFDLTESQTGMYAFYNDGDLTFTLAGQTINITVLTTTHA